jgi:COMPASS component SWD3
MVSVAADGYLAFWHAPTGKCIMPFKDPKDVDLYCVDYRRDGQVLAVGGKDGAVKVYDDTTKTLTAVLKAEGQYSLGHANRVFSVRFTDDLNILASGGWDSTVFFWDLRMSKSIGWIHGPHLCGDAMDIRGDTMLVGNYAKEDVLQLWSISQRKLIENIQWLPHAGDSEQNGFLYSAAFDRKSNGKEYIVAGGGGLNQMKVISQKSGHPILAQATFPKTVSSCSFAYNTDLLAVGCNDGFVRVYSIDKKPVAASA